MDTEHIFWILYLTLTLIVNIIIYCFGRFYHMLAFDLFICLMLYFIPRLFGLLFVYPLQKIFNNTNMRTYEEIKHFRFMEVLIKNPNSIEEFIFVKFLIRDVKRYAICAEFIMIDSIYKKDVIIINKLMKYYKLEDNKEYLRKFIDNNIINNDEILDIFIKSFNREDKDRLYLDCLLNFQEIKPHYIQYYQKQYSDHLPVMKISPNKVMRKEDLMLLEDRENFEDFLPLNRDKCYDEETVKYVNNFI